MRHFPITLSRLALLLVHAAGAGLASPAVLVTRPAPRALVEWLPRDNQTVYRLDKGEVRRLELNTSSMTEAAVFITVSPCARDLRWAVYRGQAGCSDSRLGLVAEHEDAGVHTFSAVVGKQDRYVLQLSTMLGGAAAVSVRGETSRAARMRLRVRSRRRLAANWDPSPVDPQATSYCVVASRRRNYTSLCAAQFDLKINRLENKQNRFTGQNRVIQDHSGLEASTEFDNKIEVDRDVSLFDAYDSANFNSIYRRKKYSRSTKVTNIDPVIACVGDRTHHLIENLDPSITYHVSLFGLGQDRRAGSLLAAGSVRPRTSVAKRLRESVPYAAELKGRQVFYFKSTISAGGGLWLAVSTCGGAVDADVFVRGTRIYSGKNIEPYKKIFIPAPMSSSSIQETSDEGVQFDSSSSEETRMRYVIKLTPSRRDSWNGDLGIQLIASTSRWGINTPELAAGDGASVRELRPRRSCRSVDVAFLPASHHATDVIRYCISASEIINGETDSKCHFSKKPTSKLQCINRSQKSSVKVIVRKVENLKPGRKYAIQVTAESKGSAVPYKTLYVDTNISCKNDKLGRFIKSSSEVNS
ncbi:unnamed protein product [Plutella xylostella]|uniref:(diamondback moth) hypothetical protein n=1 Tax=Plutella xylostella TaxID=51655 RepID=A0A8S4GF86_PLUXY|nr:unnamed protein product [Plutella xylostella]